MKIAFTAILLLLFILSPRLNFAQGVDSVKETTTDNSIADTFTISSLENEIEILKTEIDQLSNEDLSHEESVLQFHFILSKCDAASLESEIRRIKGRQDFYTNYTDYILPLTMLDIKTIASLKSLLNTSIQTYQKERFIALVLIKTMMNITFAQKDYRTFVSKYNSYKSFFAQNDNELLFQLTEAYIHLQQFHLALKNAETLYLSHPEDIHSFLNYSNALIQAKEFAELEFYTDKILVYKDVKSLIHLAIFLYSRGNTIEAESLVFFIDEWIQESLKNDFDFEISTFKWNFNNSKIYVSTSTEIYFSESKQFHSSEVLELLADYIAISDEKMSCRFKKYAYINTFYELETLFSAEETMYMEPEQLQEYTSLLSHKKTLIQLRQQNLLSMSCN